MLSTHDVDIALRRIEPLELERLATDPVSMAKLLSVSLSTLTRWREEGIIPFVKIGNRILFPIAAIRQWLEEKASESYKNEKGGAVL